MAFWNGGGGPVGKSVTTETGGAGYVSPSPITPLKARHGTSVCHAGAFIGGRPRQQ